MKFDPYAFLAECRDAPVSRAIHAIRATPDGPNSTNSTNSTHNGGNPESRKALPPAETLPEPSPQAPESFPYGQAVNGNPRTWTGRIVSLDEWRRLTAWERDGSTGKHWNAITRQWEPRDKSASPEDEHSRL